MAETVTDCFARCDFAAGTGFHMAGPSGTHEDFERIKARIEREWQMRLVPRKSRRSKHGSKRKWTSW